MTKTYYALQSKRTKKFWDNEERGRWVTDLHNATWMDNQWDWEVGRGSEVVVVEATGRVRK